MKRRLYDFLVNRDRRIMKRYHGFVQSHAGLHRVFPLISWVYLALLNVLFGIFNIPEKKARVSAAYESGAVRSRYFPESAEDIAEKLCCGDIVSFDVFDTLIVRPFAKPADLFYIVGERLNVPDFRSLRINAEKEARRIKKSEVTLAEIYDVLAFRTGISREEGMEAEMQTELELCSASPFMLRVWDIVRKSGKRIIAATDMYLPAGFIEKLLLKNGFEGFERIYVSCESGCGKYDGGMFRLIKNDHDGAVITHIGDNERSDKINAERSGIKAVYRPNINSIGGKYRPADMSPIIGSIYSGIVNKRLYCGEKCSEAYEYGYKCGGLLILGFCGYIRKTAEEKKADRILFFSRDGYIIKKVYDMLYPESSTEYVYWSRAAAVKLCRDIYPQEFIRRFVEQKVGRGYSLDMICRSMGISCDMLPFDGSELLTSANAEAVKNELLSRRKELSAAFADADSGAEKYFVPILDGCRNVVTVDCGWAGSGNIMLEAYVNRVLKRNIRFTGILAGTNTANQDDSDYSESFLLSGRLSAYCFSSALNREYYSLHCPARKHNIYFEMLFGAPQPSLKGFDRNGPVFDSESENAAFTEEIHRGELDFIADFLEASHGMPYIADISGSDAYAPFAAALSDNGKYMKELFGNTVFDELTDGRKEKL